MRFPKFSTETKQTVLGGAVASLVANLENGASNFVPAYPQILKDKLNPAVPRNGALIATIAPAGVAWVVTRKGRASARMEHMRTGIFLYDIPKLVADFGYSIAYQMGLPATTQGAPFRLGVSRFSRPMAQVSGGRPVGAVTGAGKYVMKVTAPKTMSSNGIGRYR